MRGVARDLGFYSVAGPTRCPGRAPLRRPGKGARSRRRGSAARVQSRNAAAGSDGRIAGAKRQRPRGPQAGKAHGCRVRSRVQWPMQFA